MADNINIRAKRDDRPWKTSVEKKDATRARDALRRDIGYFGVATMGHDGRSTAELRAWERSNGI